MHVVVVGNGITGVTAARTIRKLSKEAQITIISGESDEHWSRPALMYVYMGHMRFKDTQPYERHFWTRNRIELVRGWVTQIDVEAKKVMVDDSRTIAYDKLLLATGSKPNKFGWPGQDLEGVQGMYSVQDLVALEQRSSRIQSGVIVGGGLIGVELAEMLHSRGKHVTLLVRETDYWNSVLPAEEAAMVSAVIREEGIDLRLSTEMKEIIDDGSGQVCAVIDSNEDRIPCQMVGLTCGVRPNVGFLQQTGIPCDRGVLVDFSLRTDVKDVFAAGDCAELRTPEGERNLIQAVWYTGRMQGEIVGRVICDEEVSYDSGIWFNSAKFFDLEYQVYGTVPSEAASRRGDDTESVYWEHDDKRHALRIVHRDGVVLGLNAMGLRLRHRVCERWIQEERTVDEVFASLNKAAFDPEFFPNYVGQARRTMRGRR